MAQDKGREMAIAAMQKFVYKVDTGRARSTESYSEFKAALIEIGAPLHPPVNLAPAHDQDQHGLRELFPS